MKVSEFKKKIKKTPLTLKQRKKTPKTEFGEKINKPAERKIK